jgi:RHS repeat-associated protein
MTDADGPVVARYRYDPFGAVTHVGGLDPALAARNPLRYRAYFWDSATQLYYLPARYYEPATARFLSLDPAPPSAGDPLSLNAYAYCQGDPVNASDPTGAVMDLVYENPMGVAAGNHVVNQVKKGVKATKAQRDYRGRLTYVRDALGQTRMPVGFLNHPDAVDAGLDVPGTACETAFSVGAGLCALGNPVGAWTMTVATYTEFALDVGATVRKFYQYFNRDAGLGDVLLTVVPAGVKTSTAKLIVLDGTAVITDGSLEYPYRGVNQLVDRVAPGQGYR